MAKISKVAAISTSKGKVAKAKVAVVLTPGQKAAATKRAMGMDLTAVALKAHATRLANRLEAERLAKAEARKLAKLAAIKSAAKGSKPASKGRTH